MPDRDKDPSGAAMYQPPGLLKAWAGQAPASFGFAGASGTLGHEFGGRGASFRTDE